MTTEQLILAFALVPIGFFIGQVIACLFFLLVRWACKINEERKASRHYVLYGREAHLRYLNEIEHYYFSKL